MLYESLNNQYNTIGNTTAIRTNANHKLKNNNNFTSTDTSPEYINKHTTNTPNSVNDNQLNNHTIIPIRDNNSSKTQVNDDKFAQVVFLYDQNSIRTMKRNNQIRRIQSKLPISIDDIKIDKDEGQCKYNGNVNSNYSKIESVNFLSSTGTLKTCNESPSIIITERVTTEGQTNRLAPVQFLIEDNNLNESDNLAPSIMNSNSNNNNGNCNSNRNNDAEVNISDLDCDINKENDESESVKSQSLCSSISRSFVSLTNNLVIKKDAKEDNSTLSYLLALGQSKNNNNDNIGSNPYGNRGSELNTDNEESNKNADQKHIHLPSGKNFLISSVIEEEKSDLFTDSEISNKKLSYLLSTKHKLELALGKSDSDFKLNTNKNNNNTNGNNSLSKELIRTSVDKNLDKLFFFQMQKKTINNSNNHYYQTYYRNGNNGNRSNSNNIIDEIEISDSSWIIKEDLSTIQRNLKRTYNEIAKEYDSKEEEKKNKIESQKKAVLDLFLHNISTSIPMQTQTMSMIKQCTINTYNQTLGMKAKDQLADSHKMNFNISSDSEQKQSSNNHDKGNANKDQTKYKEEIESYEQIHDKYKESRQKQQSGSFFKSEDLKVSKMDDVYLDTSKLVSPMSNEKTDNLFFSSIKSALKNDKSNHEDPQHHHSIEKLNDVKQHLFFNNQANKYETHNDNERNTNLKVSNEISFNMQSIYHQPKIRERAISMEIIKNAYLQFEGIPNYNSNNNHHPNSNSTNNQTNTRHIKNKSYVPSLRLSQINFANNNNKSKKTNQKDIELIQGQSTAKLLNNFSSMLSQLKLKHRISLSHEKDKALANKDNNNNHSCKDNKGNKVNYLRFNTSSRDKNIFNKKSNTNINVYKDFTNQNNAQKISKPYLINSNNINNNSNPIAHQRNKCPNVVVLDNKKQILAQASKKLYIPCPIKKIENYKEDSNANCSNKKSIIATLNYLTYCKEEEKREAIKSIDNCITTPHFALYIREENHNYVSIF